MSLREASTLRDRVFTLSATLRRISDTVPGLTPEDAAKVRQAASALSDLWEDRRYAREQYCLLEVIESAHRGIEITPEDVAGSMGWPVSPAPGLYFPQLEFCKEDR